MSSRLRPYAKRQLFPRHPPTRLGIAPVRDDPRRPIEGLRWCKSGTVGRRHAGLDLPVAAFPNCH